MLFDLTLVLFESIPAGETLVLELMLFLDPNILFLLETCG
jgi:hypothetical protein